MMAWRHAGTEMMVRVVSDAGRLRPYLRAWEQLAEQALEPNVFYEPWMLLPALQVYGRQAPLEFVLVFQRPLGVPTAPEQLCGFFPFERRGGYKDIPAATLRLWHHPHCYLSTPLLHSQHSRPTLAALVHWLRHDVEGASLVELARIPAEGAFAALLAETAAAFDLPTHMENVHTRAFFCLRDDGDNYIRAALSRSHRKDLRRKERRLGAEGDLHFVTLEPGDDLDAWNDAFLSTEASGWKGRQGTALACSEADRVFFLQATHEAHRRGRLRMFGLQLDGQFIALSCHFRAGLGSYYFKTAFDERYAACSPGRLLEVEKIRWLHAERGIAWEDSCTHAENHQLNVLWLDRRSIATQVLSTGRPWGNLVVSALPWLERVYRRCFRKEPRMAFQPGRKRDFAYDPSPVAFCSREQE
jgi:CelD/BcsL family acetyltransferase involved in cellulose biosynthesis